MARLSSIFTYWITNLKRNSDTVEGTNTKQEAKETIRGIILKESKSLNVDNIVA